MQKNGIQYCLSSLVSQWCKYETQVQTQDSEHLHQDVNSWHRSRMNEFNAWGLAVTKNSEKGDKSEGLWTESTNTN